MSIVEVENLENVFCLNIFIQKFLYVHDLKKHKEPINTIKIAFIGLVYLFFI